MSNLNEPGAELLIDQDLDKSTAELREKLFRGAQGQTVVYQFTLPNQGPFEEAQAYTIDYSTNPGTTTFYLRSGSGRTYPGLRYSASVDPSDYTTGTPGHMKGILMIDGKKEDEKGPVAINKPTGPSGM